MRLAAGFRPDPLGELKRSPRPPSPNKGGLLLRGGEGRGGKGRREGEEGSEGRGVERERGWEGEGGERERGRDLAPRKKFLAPPLLAALLTHTQKPQKTH